MLTRGRKLTLTAFCLSVSFLLLAACSSSSSGGSGGSGSASSGPTTLTLWQNGSVASSDSFLTQIIKNFEAANPGVTIKVVEQPTDNYFALLHTSMISHSAPDIADLFAGTYLTPLFPYLTNLNNYLPASLISSARGAKFYAKGNNTANGTYGAPAADQFYNAFYNKSLFAKAGIQDAPSTWSQFFSDCTALKAKGILPIVYGSQGGGAEMGTHEDLSYLFAALPLEQWNGLYNGTVKYNQPTLVQQVQQWQKIYSDRCTNQNALTSQTPLQQFTHGKAAMIVGGSWLIPTFAPLGPKLGASIPPFSVDAPKALVEMPGGGYGVPSSSKHVKLATDFLAFMLSPGSQQIIARSGQPPVIASGVKITNPAMQQLLALANSGKYIQYPMFDNFTAPAVTNALDPEFGPAFVGQKSATSALSNIDSTTQSLPPDQKNVNFGFGS
jgi:ABC-type glycerol-3-phosphate transport system substrate-binding protein